MKEFDRKISHIFGIDLDSNWKDIIKPSLMLLWLVVDIFKV